MRWAALVLVACGGNAPPPPAHAGGAPPPPPPAVTCADVAEHVVPTSEEPSARAPYLELIRDRCTADAWSLEVRTCYLHAQATRPGLEECRGHLSAVQKSALEAATRAVVERQLGTQLPATPNPPTVVHPSIVVALALDGTITVGGTKVSVADLDKALAAAAKSDPDTQVIFQADAQSSMKDVSAVLQHVRSAGLTNVSFATP